MTVTPDEIGKTQGAKRISWLLHQLHVLWPGRPQTITNTRDTDFLMRFKRKECNNFIASGEDEESIDICYCGRKSDDHIKPSELRFLCRAPSPIHVVQEMGVLPSSGSLSGRQISYPGSRMSQFADTPWNPKLHLTEAPTDSYGLLCFEMEDLDTIQPIPYVRISNDSQISISPLEPVPEVLRLLKQYWKLLEPDRPNLIISITGSTSVAGIDVVKRDKLIAGLINAIRTTNGWLVTDGIDVGYTRLIGNAVGKVQILHEIKGLTVPQYKCIGVAPYGRIKGDTSFVNRGGALYIKKSHTWQGTDQAPPLNEHHTHFLLVDNGLYHPDTSVENFRSVLLHDIENKPPSGLAIPVVVMLIEGDISTIKECLLALRRNTPVMVVEGTGRAANLLAYAVSKHTLHMEIHDGLVVRQKHSEQQLQDIEQNVRQILPELNEEEIEVCKSLVAECCEMGELITVYHTNSDISVDKAILYTLLAGRSSVLDKLEISLQWDRVDVAEEKLFPQFESSGKKNHELKSIMKKAIISQKEDFIELLMEKDFVMSQFLTVRMLRSLYKEAEPDSHLRKLLKKKPNEDIHLSEVNVLLRKLVGKHEYLFYARDKGHEWEQDETFEDPYLELLLWAVLSRRGKLAVYVWKKSQRPLSAAIIATCLYHSLKHSLPVQATSMRLEYAKMRDIFERKAVELLDSCYQDDRSKSLKLVEEKCPRWGDLYMLDLALMAKNMRFISSACCQENVSNRWKNIKWKFYIRFFYRLVVMVLHFFLVLFNLTNTISLTEIIMVCLVVSDAVEKGFEAIFAKSLKLWFSAWNMFDIGTQAFFLIGFVCRLFPVTLFLGNILYGCCTMLFTARMLRLFYTHARLGPLLLIFIYMIPKLAEFMAFLLVLLVGYGITSKALMNHSCDTRNSLHNASDYMQLFEDISLVSYWKMFGELNLESIANSEFSICQNMTWNFDWISSCETCDPDSGSENCFCQESNWPRRLANRLMLAVYLIIGNVLLLNLIIAIFTNVFTDVQTKSSEHWKFEMYRLIREYERRPVVPQPFGAFVYFWRMIKPTVPKTIRNVSLEPLQNEVSLKIFEQNRAQNEPSADQTTPSDNMNELLDKMKLLEENQRYIKSKLESVSQQQEDTQPSSSEALSRILAFTERQQTLPEKFSQLEEDLRSSQAKLEDALSQQAREINELKTMLMKKADSSPSSSSM